MTHYTEQKFNIPELKGISRKTIDEHLKLYAGYVKNTNLIYDKLEEYMKDSEKHAYALGELWRRFSFEWNGMRNHEYYFKALEGGAKKLRKESSLNQALCIQYGSFEKIIEAITVVSKTRSSGWVMLCWDKESQNFITTWVDEHHLGLLSALPI